MALLQKKVSLIISLILCIVVAVSSRGAVYTPPNVERLTDRFDRVSVNQGYNVLFGGSNILMKNNGSNADLILDKSSGSGLISKNKYYHGFFNAALKLPSGFTSGVVVAFYLSNADLYPKNHDEIDIELLGHEKRRDWVLQTNIYGNGSVRTGREEKFYLWFDPTQAFHDYSILWNSHHILFLVDNVPVRQILYNNAISPVYPSKPMSAYLTIWDGSEWATHGGKYPVNYKYAPFIVSMNGVEIQGCIQQQQQNQMNVADALISCNNSKKDPSSLNAVDGEEFSKLSEQQATGLGWARGKHMFYSYCKDSSRYKVLPPECNA